MVSSSFTEPRKIAISGTSCSGKTTLFNELKRIYSNDKDIAFVDEVARSFFEKNTTMSEEERFSTKTQEKIRDLVMRAEEEAANRHPRLIVCDNSVVAAAAFAGASNAFVHAEKLIEQQRQWLATYDLFVVLNPLDIVFQNDDVRKEPAEFRDKMFELFVVLCDEYKLPYELVGGTVQERLAITEALFNR